MYIYLDKQGIVKEIINDEALRQSASNVNEIYVYYDGLQEADIGSVLATYGLPDGTITDEMEVATRTEESEIPYNAERDLKYFQYYKAYAFYHFAIADLALSQEGVVRLMVRLAQKDGEYIKVAGLICFDVEGELVKEDHGVSLAQYNYLVKAWYETKECLPLDGSKAMQGNIDMGAHNVLFNGNTLKDNNGALNYNGSDLAKQSDTSSLQSQIDTINATQNVVDIVGTKAELNAYATKDLHANDKIEVLADESQSNANTIYEWNGNAWSLVGSKAPYYSKAESDARYNELKAKSYDKDTASYVSGHVPDSALVKGSLDSVNENIGALQTDNQTTKTTIAGLVSDNTQNKKDIATLKANYTEVQSQANTNSSDIALLKTNTIKTDTDASLKSLTLPSAKDLKTKDGTSFGGGSKVYNGTEYLPTFDIATLKDIYLPLVGGILSGNLDIVKNNIYFSLDNIRTGKMGIDRTTYSETPRTSSGTRDFYTLGLYDSPKLMFKYNEAYISYSNLTYMGIDTSGITISNARYDGTIQLLSYDLSTGDLKHKFVMKSNAFPTIDDSPIITQATLATDLATKQSILYRHTVKISKPTDDGKTSITFTASSVNNTPIDSIQDLTTVFGNTDLSVSGATYLISSSQWEFYNKIHVGTSITDTTVDYINKDDVGTYNFTDMFGTTGFTITDNVTAM